MHLYEPVPQFFNELSVIWSNYTTDLKFDATLHNEGLGVDDRIVHLAASDLDGQGTFGMEENKDKKEIPLQIKEAGGALK